MGREGEFHGRIVHRLSPNAANAVPTALPGVVAKQRGQFREGIRLGQNRRGVVELGSLDQGQNGRNVI